MLFDNISPADLDDLEGIGTHKQYKMGTYILEEGTVGSTFSVILSGTIEIRKNLNSKQSKAIAELYPCDLIGELGLFGIEERSASAVAVTDCDLLEFDKDAFDKFTMAKPKIGIVLYRNIVKTIADRLTKTNTKLQDSFVAILSQPISPTTKPYMDGIRQNHSLKLRDLPRE